MFQKRKNVRELIESAYLHCLTEKYYLDISVTDVVNEAGCARASFYRNYSSTADVLESILRQFHQVITKDVIPMFMTNPEMAWRTLCLQLFTELSNGSAFDFKVLPENIEFIMTNIERSFHLRYYMNNSTMVNKYTPFINFGILFAATRVWIESGMKETPQEITDYICNIINYNLRNTDESQLKLLQ